MISNGLLVVGYVMFALICSTAVLCIAFVLYFQHKSSLGTDVIFVAGFGPRIFLTDLKFSTHPLVRIAQPPLLITICVGCIISAVSILPMGSQTEYRYIKDEISTGELTEEVNPDITKVDAACMM